MAWTLSGFADEAGNSCDEQICALEAAGITAVDMRKIDGHRIDNLPVEKARDIRKKLDAAKITVAYFGSPIGKADIADDFEVELAKLRHLGSLKDVLGCRAVRIFSYFNKNGASPQEWQKQSLDRLKRLRDLAGQLGLVLWHENERHIFGDRCEQVQVLARELRDGKTFKLIYDFDNFHQSGDDNWDNWQKLKGATDAFHLKDSDAKNQHVPVGAGAGKVKQILTDALKSGWTGPLSLEPHLSHSGAVADTGPHGQANQAYASKTPAECFQIAADAAKKLLKEIGAKVA